MPSFGATRAQWAHWSLILGLTEDLLPVVSNPGAQIAGESTLKTIGKVPSRYNARGLVVGIKEWTSLRATIAQCEAWSKRDDYGICLQTRSIRAIDVDVGDVAIASDLRARLCDLLGLPLNTACHGRPGSARVALALRVVGVNSGGLAKRVITLRDGAGAIEFLAGGQQFIIAGTYSSGGRYFWVGGEPDAIPTVTLEQLDACWAALDSEFGDGSWTGGGLADHRSAARGLGRLNGVDRAGADDPVAAWLAARGWVIGQDRDKLWVACPWADEHTVDTGGSSTAWFCAGTGGYEQGHFECLHAHCARRSDTEFLEAVGYEQSFAEDFEMLGPGLAAGVDRAGLSGAAPGPGGAAGAVGVGAGATGGALVAVQDPCASWWLAGPGQGLTKGKKGKWAATAVNVARALATAGWWRRVQWDEFRQELFWSAWSGPGVGELVAWRSDDFFKAREQLELANFEPMGKELLRDAIFRVARADGFDSAQRWLGGLQWDGVDRVPGFLTDYFDAQPCAYAAAVSCYLWTAMAGRVLDPGCKADMVPILQTDRQGMGKSSGIEAIAPHRDFYTTLDLAERDDALSRRLRGILVAELVELRGLKSREHESIKAWVSQRADRWVPKYEELAVTVQRRFVMVGTTNETDFLSDATGNRRWLPIAVGQGNVEAIERDREQLWAQAAALFTGGGVAWRDAELRAAAEHEQWESEEIGIDAVEQWLVENPAESYRTEQVLREALGYDRRNIRIMDEKRVSRIMRKLHYSQFVRRINGKNTRIWLTATNATL